MTQILGALHITPGQPGDRGCVACGHIIPGWTAPDNEEIFIIDARERYWCLDCVMTTLAHVKRRNDERTNYVYPWSFDDTGGPNGQRRVQLHAVEIEHEQLELVDALDNVEPTPEEIAATIAKLPVTPEVWAAQVRARVEAAQRKPELSYVRLGGGKAQVTCLCGWKDEPMPVSPFDPMEALVGASSVHTHCEDKS